MTFFLQCKVFQTRQNKANKTRQNKTITMAATTKSTLSTESPPFNPTQRSVLYRGSSSPIPSTTYGNPINSNSSSNNSNSNSNNHLHGAYRSRSSSPFPTDGPNNPNSNAQPKYTFQYNGYVMAFHLMESMSPCNLFIAY